MKAFRDALTADFEEKLVAYLKQKLAESGAPFSPETIPAGARAGVQAAAGFGLTREADVARYVEIVFLHLGGFSGAEHPVPALQILYSWGLDPGVKLDRFEQWAKSQRQAG